ncbi:MAG: single-stranded-DNA-specific exonuclease RecJ [Magnetococcus sp. WYHC-3]
MNRVPGDAPVDLSLRQRVWRWRVEPQGEAEALAREAGLPRVLAGVLTHRGLTRVAEVEAFLNPRLSQLPDPAGLRDMDRAVARLVRAVEHGESLAVFGDYDVDGATSSALLVRFFAALGLGMTVYVPDRLREGYGPNAAALRQLAARGIAVVITVDCGISAHEALAVARDVGLDVIVTDHHRAGEELPPAVAVLNPNRRDETFARKELAGVGVAFYLVMALNRALRQRGWYGPRRPEPDLKQLLDLVAVGTIADVALLTGVNRPLVSAGLRQARLGGNVGLAALAEVSGVKPPLGAGTVGFQLGPRLNAGGRLGQSDLGPELLITENAQRAMELARLLDQSNRERQRLEQSQVEAAVAQVQAGEWHVRRRGLVVWDNNWHEGVNGIVASRLVERYHRPAVVLAVDDASGLCKGSARSIPGVDLYALLCPLAGLMVRFGGHAAAAGMTLEARQLEAFAAAFDAAVRQSADEALFVPSQAVDGVLEVGEISLDFCACLEQLEPYGMGNPQPVFLLRRVWVRDPRPIKDVHVKCRITDDGGAVAVAAMAFRVLPGALGQALLAPAGPLDVVATLSINDWQGRRTAQLTLLDARPAAETAAALQPPLSLPSPPPLTAPEVPMAESGYLALVPGAGLA